MSALPVTDKRLLEIKQAQADDATCQNIPDFCMHGWPDKAKLGSEDKLYLKVAADVTIQKGVLRKGSRLVIQVAMQKRYLERPTKDTKESLNAENVRNNPFGGRV